MALTTFAGLKTAIDDYLARTDMTSAYKADYFLTLAHYRIHNGNSDPRFPSEPVRVRAMEASSDLTISAQTVALPTRYLQMRRIYLNTSPITKLDFLPPMDFWAKYVSTTGGTPKAFTIEGENIVLGPVPDGSYTGKILYYQGFALPSSDSDTNWLMTNAPGAYLHSAMIEAGMFIRDEAAIAIHGPAFAGVIGGIMLADKRDRYSGAPLMMRTDSGNP